MSSSIRDVKNPILANGINYSTGGPLFDPLKEQAFATELQASLSRNADELRNLTRIGATGTTFRSGMERVRTAGLYPCQAA
jgi:hypothetical protein